MLVDMLDRVIAVGDIVIYTAPGAGRNLPPLQFGEVVTLTKAGVTVKKMNADRSYVQTDEYVMVGTGRFWTDHKQNSVEYQKREVIGQRDADPENIRWYPNRFYVMEQI